MLKAGLDDLTAVLSSVCGDLVCGSTKRGKTETFLRVSYGHRDPFKAAVRSYIQFYNRQHKTGVSVAFPNAFTIRLRASQKNE
jgi:hypothetical protein